jgi:hypothetical protein
MLFGPSAIAAEACKIDKPAADKIVVEVRGPQDLGNAASAPKAKAQLKDILTFRPVANAPGTPASPPPIPPECVSKLVLFINGLAVPDALPLRESPLTFILNRTEKSKEIWRLLLGQPSVDETRDLTVGFGLPDGPALYSAGIKLEALPGNLLFRWLVILAGLLTGFFLCAIKTSILRDGTPDPQAPAGSKGTYSLARTQAAWWLFVILACYMIIGVATGDFLTSINGTAVVLLGIGAGTALGGAAVDVSKDTPKNRAATAAAKEKVSALAAGAPAGAASMADEQEKEARATAQSQYMKLMGASESFLKDILSDANGVSFHRFQMVAWTLVLSAVFVEQVYENMAMPTFGPVLLGLLGLSAGTYVGLKIPEPVVPQK